VTIWYVERRERAWLEVSDLNPGFYKCAYFVKQTRTSVVEGVWWWPVGWNIFSFSFVILFQVFFIFLFFKI